MNGLTLNRNQMKYFVIVTMLIDHIAWAFVPTASLLGQIMHFIGRFTAPTMAFFIAEGYQHTRNVKRYAMRLGIFALISWAPFCFFEYGVLPVMIKAGAVQTSANAIRIYLSSIDRTILIFPYFGVLYTLFLSLLAIWLWDKGKISEWRKTAGIAAICMLSIFGDWAVFAVLYALIFYCYRDQPGKKWSAYYMISSLFLGMVVLSGGDKWWKSLFQFGVLVPPLFLQFCYHGEGGSKKPIHKWFFYIFYPVHLVLLRLLRWLLF